MVTGSVYMNMFSPTATLCFLVGRFNPFTFKVIVNMYDLIQGQRQL